MLKALFVLGGLAIAALGGTAWVFSLGQHSVTYTLHLTVRDAAGQPLAGQPVRVWLRDYPTQNLQLDANGELTLLATESFGASALTGPKRPDSFGVRLQLPTVSPLYYWFAVARAGPLGPYEVYNDSYSHNYTQWVGDFDATGPVRRQLPAAANGQRTAAVAPLGGTVVCWQGTATLERLADNADGRRHYALGVQLQQQPAVALGAP